MAKVRKRSPAINATRKADYALTFGRPLYVSFDVGTGERVSVFRISLDILFGQDIPAHIFITPDFAVRLRLEETFFSYVSGVHALICGRSLVFSKTYIEFAKPCSKAFKSGLCVLGL